mgnify:CR=1 FL=1
MELILTHQRVQRNYYQDPDLQNSLYQRKDAQGKATMMATSGIGKRRTTISPTATLRVLPTTAGQGCAMGLAGVANTSKAEAPKGASKPKRSPCQCIAQPNKRQNKAINTRASPAVRATRQRSRATTSMGGGNRFWTQRGMVLRRRCI